MELDARIQKFIAKHHVLTLATAIVGNDGLCEPYCANMFYAFDSEQAKFVFTSSDDTYHVQQMMKNSRVAGSIVLETTVVGKLQGVQFEGEISRVDSEKMRALYIYRYPFVVLSDLNLWQFTPYHIKFTDNRLGFGKKLNWNRNE